jgi:uncharacterized membrane protein
MTDSTSPLSSFAEAIEHQSGLDALADRIQPLAAALAEGPWAGLLRGEPLGHAAHPMLSDLPLGCFTSATLVDLVGGRRGAPAARRLVAIGLLSLPVTAASGLVDWHEASADPRVRRAGVVHAAGNLLAGMLYLSSYRHRRGGRRFRGALLTMGGSALAAGAGYLGGHMAFTRAAGQGERDRPHRTVHDSGIDLTERVVHPPDAPIADQMLDPSATH